METIVRNRRLLSYENSQEVKPLLKLNHEGTVHQNDSTPTDTKLQQPQSQNIQEDKAMIPLHLKATRATLYVLTRALNIAYVPLFVYRTFEKSQRCPPITDDLLMIPASDLARKIRKKEISCEALIQTYIKRIKEVNPIINAVIEDRFSEALNEAKKVDELVSSKDFLDNEDKIGQELPLLGIPLTIKGSISVKGLGNTSGMIKRKDAIAENDAEIVALARKAGAIPLLVSNVPELCMNWETHNKLKGTTKNPHDSTRTCGGSSGGEASLLGSGASLIGLGSDIAGSLRLPAHYCGVWGHKPTPAVVSHEGHYPSCPHKDRWEAVFTLGPMARYAGDLRTLLKVICMDEEKAKLDLETKIDFKDIRIYYIENLNDLLCHKPNEHCTEALQSVVNHFKNVSGEEPQKVDIYLLQYASLLATLHLLDVDDVENIFDNNATGVFTELLKYATFRSKHTFTAIAYGLLRKLYTVVPDTHKKNIKEILQSLRDQFEKILGKNGILIIPTYPVEATKHGDWLRFMFDSGFMSIFNALGFPVTNCPVAATKKGLPIGIQVVGLPYSDKLTLTVAEEIERAFGGWIAPTL